MTERPADRYTYPANFSVLCVEYSSFLQINQGFNNAPCIPGMENGAVSFLSIIPTSIKTPGRGWLWNEPNG